MKLSDNQLYTMLIVIVFLTVLVAIISAMKCKRVVQKEGFNTGADLTYMSMIKSARYYDAGMWGFYLHAKKPTTTPFPVGRLVTASEMRKYHGSFINDIEFYPTAADVLCARGLSSSTSNNCPFAVRGDDQRTPGSGGTLASGETRLTQNNANGTMYITRVSCAEDYLTKYGYNTCWSSQTLIDPPDSSCIVRILNGIYRFKKVCLKFDTARFSGNSLTLNGTNAPIAAFLRPTFISMNAKLYSVQHSGVYQGDTLTLTASPVTDGLIYPGNSEGDNTQTPANVVLYYLDFDKEAPVPSSGTFPILANTEISNSGNTLTITCTTSTLRMTAICTTTPTGATFSFRTEHTSGAVNKSTLPYSKGNSWSPNCIPNFARIAITHGYILTTTPSEHVVDI